MMEPLAPRDHGGKRVFAAAKHRCEVHRQQPVPLRVGHLENRHPSDGDRGVVHEDVDPAVLF